MLLTGNSLTGMCLNRHDLKTVDKLCILPWLGLVLKVDLISAISNAASNRLESAVEVYRMLYRTGWFLIDNMLKIKTQLLLLFFPLKLLRDGRECYGC